MSRESLIDDVINREAIRQLPVLYCHCVRNRDVERMLDLFADECEMTVTGEGDFSRSAGVFPTKKDVRKMFADGLPKSDLWPFVHNHVIELKDDTHATGFVYAEIRSGAAHHHVIGIGIYTDEYVKVGPAKWKFKSRKFNGTSISRVINAHQMAIRTLCAYMSYPWL